MLANDMMIKKDEEWCSADRGKAAGSGYRKVPVK